MDNGPRILLPPEARQKISAAWEEICRKFKSPALRQIEFERVMAQIRFEYPECFNAKSEPTAPLLAQVGSTDGLGVAVPSAPTFEQGEKK